MLSRAARLPLAPFLSSPSHARTLATKAPIVFDYEELAGPSTPDLLKRIEVAYGFDGLGIVGVRGVPNVVEKRRALLPLAFKLAHLPDETLKSYEDPQSYFSVGWSHGKEKLEGKPDYSKGSFYANPLYDLPVDSKQMIDKWPAFYRPNIWPREVPALEAAFKDMGQLIVHTGTLLAAHCDALVKSKLPSYTDLCLHKVILTSRCCKGRLLHYFPSDHGSVPIDTTSQSSWCGWHNDHGSLTGLTVAMYQDKDGNEVPCPDPAAGLYARSRQGDVTRIVLPSDHLAFQIGETAQIQSGGVLQATPHSVQASPVKGVSRSTFAVFMEPDAWYPMTTPAGANVSDIYRGARGELLPKGVPPLEGRWAPQDDFGGFSQKTFESYY